MDEILLSNAQARRFMLAKQGLAGEYIFEGKQGALDYVRRAGCIQFDPVDVCGKNAELVLQSRVHGFEKRMLYELLYSQRSLVDYFDKNLAIIPVEDWPYFERYRAQHRSWERSHDEIAVVRGEIRRLISERGPLCSADLDMPQKVNWYWSATKLSRAALESMYFSGELAVHHKSGSIKYYDLIENCLPAGILNQPDPYPDEHAHRKWRVKRRIAGVGMLGSGASYAYINIDGLNTVERNAIFSELLADGEIVPLNIEGMRGKMYALAGDIPLIESCMAKTAPDAVHRCEFIAPLDNMLWDRKLISGLFGFDYKWEIYTPVEQRKYGHYVLPVLYGDRFIGRAELTCDRRHSILDVKNIWYEADYKPDRQVKAALRSAVKLFAKFNECADIQWSAKP